MFRWAFLVKKRLFAPDGILIFGFSPYRTGQSDRILNSRGNSVFYF